LPPFATDALERALLLISQLAWQLREAITVIDINPLVVLARGQGIKALDALIVRKGVAGVETDQETE
jgi:succinyl-CoA synthetase beta subunit